MTRMPRDLSGRDLISALTRIGYRVTRPTGSHVRLTADLPDQHPVPVANHDPLGVGTLAAIIGEVAQRRGVSRGELVRETFG